MRNASTFVLVVLSYVILGYASLQLAIPPGYASAIFPPAGLALASLIIWGRRYAVAIFLGSLSLNLLTSAVSGTLTRPAIIFSALTGVGAMLQALVGWYLVHRFTARPLLLVKNREIILYTVVIGPLSCLVNSLVGSGSLYAVGFIKASAWLPTWFTWWVGDSIGLALMSPLLFTFFLKPAELWRPRRLAVGLPILVMTSSILCLFFWVSSATENNQDQRFTRFSSDLFKKIEVSFTSHVDALASLERLVTIRPGLTAREFEEFTRYALGTKLGINGLSWNPVIHRPQRPAFEEDVRSQGFAGFSIMERNEDGELVVASDRDEYITVKYIEPLAQNSKAHGFDVGSNAKRRESLDAARDSGHPQATPRITLVQDEGEQAGILLFYPVYKQAVETLEQRREGILGFAVGVFKVGDIVDELLNPETLAVAHLAMFDRSDDPPTHLYGETDVAPFERAGHHFRGSLVLGDRTWEVLLWPKPGFIGVTEAMAPWFVTVTGLLFTIILAAVLLILTGTTYYLNTAVRDRTRILTRLNQELEQFAYIASHDLQEPVRTVGSFVNLLDKQYGDKLDDKGREYMKFCIDAAQRMRQLIKDLLEYSRVGVSNRPFQDIDMQQLVDTVLKDLKTFLDETHARVDLSEPLPRHVTGEPVMLAQLIQNLIKNGVKFRHAERTPEIRISFRETPEEWIFSFHDNGIGINKEHLESIFIIFRRLHTRQEYEGTGIGLAVAKRIATQHEGRIWVDSSLGMGSTFHFSISKRLTLRAAGQSPGNIMAGSVPLA